MTARLRLRMFAALNVECTRIEGIKMNQLIVEKPISDKQRIRLLEKEAKILFEALQFYADPGTYFATRVAVDPPCGEFYKDYGKITPEQEERFGWDGYRAREDVYYGKTARKAIAKAWMVWEKHVKSGAKP